MLALFLAALESPEDRRRFAALYEAYHGRMERIALGILQNQSDAEDAVQEAFCQVIRHYEKTEQIPCEELPFWIISIVKNEARMILRKRRKAVPLEDWDGFEENAARAADYGALVSLFRQLPETCRVILELKILAGYSDKEIARKLNLSETAVSTRASRGRALLRSLAEKGGLHP